MVFARRPTRRLRVLGTGFAARGEIFLRLGFALLAMIAPYEERWFFSLALGGHPNLATCGQLKAAETLPPVGGQFQNQPRHMGGINPARAR